MKVHDSEQNQQKKETLLPFVVSGDSNIWAVQLNIKGIVEIMDLVIVDNFLGSLGHIGRQFWG